METVTVTVSQFVKANQISMTAERTDRNPNMDDSANMDHWKVVLTIKALKEGFDTWHGYKGKLGARQYSTRKLTTYFSQDYGHNGAEPKVTDVLDCLASDASSIDNARGFEDWCSDFGYDSDSRKAEKTFKACEHGAKRLKTFLDDDLYAQLLYGTERC
ncbi:MAG: hypothetical protein WA766_17640 [Candidatus Acidiferrales bacterium]